MHEESLLQQQIQIRQTKQGILPLFATYLLCRQRNGQITVSNKDLGRLFGIGDKRIQSLKRELFEKGIIAIKDAKDTLEIKDMETLQYMANDY